MSKSNAGCGAWIIIGSLVVAALGQCGKEEGASAPPSSLANLQSETVPEQWLYVQPRRLNCRASPTATSASLRTLSGGEPVGVLETRGDWSQLKGGVLCWAKTRYLGPEKAQPSPSNPRRERDDAKPAIARLSAAAVRRRMISDSIDRYPGNCPCPYNTTRNGARCGGRSAYSRGGGYAPLCYAGDISAADIDAWRQQE